MKFSKKMAGQGKKMNETDSVTRLSGDIYENVRELESVFGPDSDLIVRFFKLKNNRDFIGANIYIKSLVDRGTVNSLSVELSKLKCGARNGEFGINVDTFMSNFSGLREAKVGYDYEALFEDLLAGNIVLLIDGCKKYLAIMADSDEGRQVDEPSSQTVIRGPKEGFTEKIECNILLIRKRIKSPDLRVEYLSLGSITRTRVSLMYLHRIAKEEIVREVRNRLNNIQIDSVLESGYIEELIKDDRYSIFPTFLSSEKPDSVVGALLEGKVAILVDGSPYVLTVPALMIEFLQSSEDYYHHFIISSIIRFLRIVAALLTLLVPAIYIALTTYHQEIIPTPLLISIASQREDVPFPALVEAMMMEVTFEILREAGIRMPRAIGPAISIVGALVLGQAAVEAGIISAVMVIVVSITAISSFAIPNYEMSNAIRLLRFILMLLAGVLGLYGIIMGTIILSLHLCKIKSVTVPYLTPLAPKIEGKNKDTVLRFPLWTIKDWSTGVNKADGARMSGNNPVDQRQKEKPEF